MMGRLREYINRGMSSVSDKCLPVYSPLSADFDDLLVLPFELHVRVWSHSAEYIEVSKARVGTDVLSHQCSEAGEFSFWLLWVVLTPVAQASVDQSNSRHIHNVLCFHLVV